jgi:hypothetical protein
MTNTILPNRGRRRSRFYNLTQLYVNKDTGNNSNGGIDPALPLQTIQAAIDRVCNDLDCQNADIVINLATSATPYSEQLVLKNHTANSVDIVGNTASPGQVIIDPDGAGAGVFADQVFSRWHLWGMTLRNSNNASANNCLEVTQSDRITLYDMAFGDCGDGYHVAAYNRSMVRFENTTAIAGSAAQHLDVLSQSQVRYFSTNLNLAAGTTFTGSFLGVYRQSMIDFRPDAITGSATGDRGYVGVLSGLYTTNGDWLDVPGDAGGTVESANFGVLSVP